MLENSFKIRPICLRNMKVSTLLLKRAASRGLTLAQIGQIICRPDDDDTEPSLLEQIVEKAQQQSVKVVAPKQGKIRKNHSFGSLIGASSNLLPRRSRLLSEESSNIEQLQPNGFSRA